LQLKKHLSGQIKASLVKVLTGQTFASKNKRHLPALLFNDPMIGCYLQACIKTAQIPALNKLI